MGSRCGTGQALRSEPDSTRVAAGVRGSSEAGRESDRPKAKRKTAAPPSFLEFVAPGAKAITNCTVEVQAAQGGKLRLELKAVATTELADLIRAFMNQ